MRPQQRTAARSSDELALQASLSRSGMTGAIQHATCLSQHNVATILQLVNGVERRVVHA